MSQPAEQGIDRFMNGAGGRAGDWRGLNRGLIRNGRCLSTKQPQRLLPLR